MNDTDLNETGRNGVISPLVLSIVDFCLLNAAFLSVYFWRRGTYDLNSPYVKLLAAFYGFWLFVSLSTKKFRLRECEQLLLSIWTLVSSGIYLAYCVAVILVLRGLYMYSRGQVFGTCLLFVFLECLLFTAIHLYLLRRRTRPLMRQLIFSKGPSRVSWPLAGVDFVLVGVSFFLVNYLKRDNFNVLPDYEKLLLLIYGVWFACSLATKKFEQLDYTNYYHAFWPWIKASFLMAFCLGIILFMFRFIYFSRIQVFGSVVLLLVLEFLFYRLYFVNRKMPPKNGDIESMEQMKNILKQKFLPLTTDVEALKQAFLSPIRRVLEHRYLKDDRGLLALMDRCMDLDGILRAEMAIRKSSEMLYPNSMGEPYKRLFINLKEINDVRYINRYFLSVYNLLIPGGHFVGRAHTITTHRKRMLRKYPRHIANGLYALDFLFNRVFPKIPWIKQGYFAFTKGKNRIISRAELLGRLSFCGFEIVGEKEIDERLCFVGRKARTSSLDQSPSYGPLVAFERIGAGNRPIRTYKFRTMHPYSEFLQDYIYKNNGLSKGGKIENDFRITAWGRVMRKLWLDELPMLCNWVRSDLQLFGVRPLSIHYLSLYPQDLKELRTKVKPGLVPPFYADMPKTFEEICSSERRYIQAYLERPVRTQWVYSWKAFYNIVFRGARSN